ncbi:MAG: ABC transporter substrate-binding protein [Chitinophagaceae bacterium]|nr:ABC transporter substrate-binding protein [Chitinophagaceae bacterium]
MKPKQLQKKLVMLCTALLWVSAVWSAADSLRLQLKWWHQFQFAGYYAAQVKGFYAEQGLKVKIIPGDASHAPVEEVVSGRADFGITGSDLLVDYSKGKPVVAVGAVFQHSPYIIISLRSSKINVPSDLIGKKVMASENQGWVELSAVFQKEAIPVDSIKMVNHSWRNEDLIDGKVDAMTAYISVEVNQLRKLGVDPVYMQPINYGIDFYGDVLFSTRKMAETDPETLNRFRRASFKGWEYAMSHTSEMADYILSLPGVQERGVTKDDLLVEAEEMRKLILPDLVEVGHMNEGRWQHILEMHKKLGVIPETQTLGNFLYDGTKTVSSKFLRDAMYVSIGVVILLLLSVIYGVSLRKAVQVKTAHLQQEISERTRAQELLLLSEQRLEVATIAAGLGIWDWDLQTNKVYYNDIWKTMLGYRPDELPDVFDTFDRLLHPDEKDAILQQLQDHIAGNVSSYQAIIRMRTKDRRWKWILTMSKVTLRNEAGVAIRLSGVHLDVDQIKQKELELHELSQELMNSNRELQQFAYITSHNLRAPVANLISLLSLFEKEELSERNQLFLEKIEMSVMRLHSTLHDLNEILSTRSNKADEQELLYFDEELANVMQLISEELRLREAVVTSNFSKAPSIYYSRKALHSILLNLLTNAVKYRQAGKAPVIQVTTDEDGEFVILSVKDNGMGIDMEKYGNKIFGLYQRFHENKDGKGLGLYIIKNQVEALEGKIAVESIVNQGTMFHVFLKKKKQFYA